MFKHNLGEGADLRILELRHAPEFLQTVEENRTYWGEYLGWALSIQTLDDARAFLKRGVTRYAEDGLPWVGIWQDERMVGGVLFFPLEARIKATSVGYWLAESAAGHGLMTRALWSMLGYVFDDLKLNRVGLEAELGNARSRAVADRLGFTFEGVRRDGWVNNSGYVDIAVYSILARDWHEKAQL